jgi:hypothetical protein
VQGAAGNLIQDAEVELSITGTSLNQLPLALAPATTLPTCRCRPLPRFWAQELESDIRAGRRLSAHQAPKHTFAQLVDR